MLTRENSSVSSACGSTKPITMSLPRPPILEHPKITRGSNWVYNDNARACILESRRIISRRTLSRATEELSVIFPSGPKRLESTRSKTTLSEGGCHPLFATSQTMTPSRKNPRSPPSPTP